MPPFSFGDIVKVPLIILRRSRILLRAICGSPLSLFEIPGPVSLTMMRLPFSTFNRNI